MLCSTDYGKLLITHADFPKPGIVFYDFSALIGNPHHFKSTIVALATKLQHYDYDIIAGIDARGFIFGGALAFHANKGFVMLRKPGKLPGDLTEMAYDLEYGTNVLSLQKNTVQAGQRVLIIDDVLATGGTAHIASRLISNHGAHVVAMAFIIEIAHLNARASLPHPVESLIVV